MKNTVSAPGKIEVIDRMDGEVIDRIHAVEAARRLAAYHNGGDYSSQRLYQYSLENGSEHETAGFIYRLAKERA